MSKTECSPAGGTHFRIGGWGYGGGQAGGKLKGVRGTVLLDNNPSQYRGWLRQATVNLRQAKIYWYVLWYVGKKTPLKWRIH